MMHRFLFVPLAAVMLICGSARGQEVVHGGTVVSGFAPQAAGTTVIDPGGWHAGYYHTAWGQPVALVVPPTATHQTNWGWGIGNTRVTPIYPQFEGPMTAVPSQYRYGPHRPTPFYVSDTLQFGVYYIRGPW